MWLNLSSVFLCVCNELLPLSSLLLYFLKIIKWMSLQVVWIEKGWTHFILIKHFQQDSSVEHSSVLEQTKWFVLCTSWISYINTGVPLGYAQQPNEYWNMESTSLTVRQRLAQKGSIDFLASISIVSDEITVMCTSIIVVCLHLVGIL